MHCIDNYYGNNLSLIDRVTNTLFVLPSVVLGRQIRVIEKDGETTLEVQKPYHIAKRILTAIVTVAAVLILTKVISSVLIGSFIALACLIRLSTHQVFKRVPKTPTLPKVATDASLQKIPTLSIRTPTPIIKTATLMEFVNTGKSQDLEVLFDRDGKVELAFHNKTIPLSFFMKTPLDLSEDDVKKFFENSFLMVTYPKKELIEKKQDLQSAALRMYTQNEAFYALNRLLREGLITWKNVEDIDHVKERKQTKTDFCRDPKIIAELIFLGMLLNSELGNSNSSNFFETEIGRSKEREYYETDYPARTSKKNPSEHRLTRNTKLKGEAILDISKLYEAKAFIGTSCFLSTSSLQDNGFRPYNGYDDAKKSSFQFKIIPLSNGKSSGRTILRNGREVREVIFPPHTVFQIDNLKWNGKTNTKNPYKEKKRYTVIMREVVETNGPIHMIL